MTPNVFRRLSGTPDAARLSKKKTAVVFLEYQNEHFTGQLPIEAAYTVVAPAVKLLNWADKHKIMVCHVRHLAKSPASAVFAPESAGAAFYPELAPRKTHAVYTKYASSAFAGSLLHTDLESAGIDTLILAGLDTPTTVSATAHDARLLGYKTIVAADLCAARDTVSWDKNRITKGDQMNDIALSAIADKYAQVELSTAITALELA